MGAPLNLKGGLLKPFLFFSLATLKIFNEI